MHIYYIVGVFVCTGNAVYARIGHYGYLSAGFLCSFKTLTHICERVVVKFVRGCYQRSGRDGVYISVSYKTGFHFIVYVKRDKVPYTAEFVNVIHNVFLRDEIDYFVEVLVTACKR